MKKILYSGIILLISSIIVIACRKVESKSSFRNNYREKISLWLDSEKSQTDQGRNQRLQSLKENLDFNSMSIENLNSEEQIIVIPINLVFITRNNKGKEVINNLVVF